MRTRVSKKIYVVFNIDFISQAGKIPLSYTSPTLPGQKESAYNAPCKGEVNR